MVLRDRRIDGDRIGILTVELSDLQQKYTDEDRRVQDKKAQITEAIDVLVGCIAENIEEFCKAR